MSRRKSSRIKQDNKGFTLVELLVGIAVIAIVSGLIGVFLIFSTRTYGKVTDEADLQEDAQILLSQMDNYIIDTDSALRYYADESESGSGTEILKDSLYPGGADGLTKKWLEIYKTTDSGYTKETILWTKSTGKLTYKQETIDTAGAVTENIEEQDLASDVTDFSIDLTKVISLRQVTVSVALTSGDRSYSADTTVYLRNQIVVNGDPYTPDDTPVISSVLSVKVLPQTVIMKPGGRKAFQAIVYGNNSPSQEVTWSLSGNTSALTTISEDGVLWISMDEKAATLTVTATSVQDPTKSGSAVVTVVHGKKLSLGQIRKYWLQRGMSMYVYSRVNGTLSGSITWECSPQDLLSANPTDAVTVAGGYPSLDLMHARRFVTSLSTPLGEYTVKVSGIVDGQPYEDIVTIEVVDASYVSGGSGIVNFDKPNGLDYWVHAGDTLNLSTVLKRTDLGTKRRYEFAEGGNIDKNSYTYETSGSDDERLTVKIDEAALDGEIYVTVKVGNQYQTGYDTITIHVAESLDFPYVVETTYLPERDNSFWARVNFRGPVLMAESTQEFTNLTSGINGLIANTGEPYKLTTSEQWTGEDVRTLSGVNEFTQNGPPRYQSNKIINMEGIIIIDRDITFDAMTIRSIGDTVIYVKGEHTISFNCSATTFDGLIYAPEGTVKFDCQSGYSRGVIIAKNLDMRSWGNADFSFMEKDTVMDLVNTLKAN